MYVSIDKDIVMNNCNFTSEGSVSIGSAIISSNSNVEMLYGSIQTSGIPMANLINVTNNKELTMSNYVVSTVDNNLINSYSTTVQY
jgi:hypothetical protein